MSHGDASPKKQPVNGRWDVFTVENFLGAQDCVDLIADSERRGFEEAAINTASGQQVVKSVRNNDRVIFDNVSLATQWWSLCAEFFPASFGRWSACGLNERFRFYRYRPGQRFSAHRDGSFQRSPSEMSWMTFMVYLNAGFEGGRTRFDLSDESEPVVIEPSTGRALAFIHDRLHEGEELVSGIKYVLRTDVMYRRDA
jgi:prolyl 4-hydroxylase